MQRLVAPATDLLVVVVAAVAIYLWVILATRLLGLRSFAKMSAFDFAMTIATGSVIATVALGSVPLTSGMTAIAVLFVAQFAVARLRRGTGLDGVIDNRPLLLLYEGRILDDHLAKARLTRGDLMGKLRAADVTRVAAVRLVVLETTGDISVITSSGPLDAALLDGVELGDAAADVARERT
ncbi:MAG TPA: YetF domain-containing protein [Egicoccus sp.]|nr:YetF domain-containing protein [Egicoccus sp.]HSK22607.1 YetF domain-containing protein [Egicoccus sp.]